MKKYKFDYENGDILYVTVQVEKSFDGFSCKVMHDYVPKNPLISHVFGFNYGLLEGLKKGEKTDLLKSLIDMYKFLLEV